VFPSSDCYIFVLDEPDFHAGKVCSIRLAIRNPSPAASLDAFGFWPWPSVSTRRPD